MDTEFARQYYESARAEHWWFRGRSALVHGLLRQKGIVAGLFVDLGAGAESLLPSELTAIKLDVVRPDPTPELFVQASAEHLPFPSDCFDGIGLFDVLEHLAEPFVALTEMKRILRPGGILIVTVPAHPRLWSPHDDLVGHERRYVMEGLCATLSTSGFQVEWISAFYGFLLPPAVVRSVFSLQSPMSLPGRLLNGVLTRAAIRSSERTLRSPTKMGLSLAAVATLAV